MFARVGLADRFNWIVKQCADKRVLDVGACGVRKEYVGNPHLWVHAAIAEVASGAVGIDISGEMVEYIRRRGYDVRVGDAEDFDLNETFDVVHAGSLIEHLSNPGRFLDCAREHLDNGGRLVLTTPNGQHPRSWLFGHSSPGHLQLYNLDILERLLRRHGFRIVERRYLDVMPNPTLKGSLYTAFLHLLPQFSIALGVAAGRK